MSVRYTSLRGVSDNVGMSDDGQETSADEDEFASEVDLSKEDNKVKKLQNSKWWNTMGADRSSDGELDTDKTGLLSCNGEPTVPYLESRTKAEEIPFPKSVFLIVGNEFCERFCFYGLRAVLVLYVSQELLMTEKDAVSFFHGWIFLCYFTTLLGGIIADSFMGKYWTIFWLSLVYLAGNVVLSVAATKPLVSEINNERSLSMFGLILIAFGAGGIKPCVSTFGGEQFQLPHQKEQLSKFFSIFYFSINAGSLLSTFVTPIFREDVTCFERDCFPLAFGVPAILMLIAIVMFVCGTSQYKILKSEDNIILNVMKCILYAGYLKISSLVQPHHNSLHRSSENGNPTDAKTSHWLDLAADRFSWSLIEEIKILFRIWVLFLPLPLFWALFDQQGSTWTFQALKMCGHIGPWNIKPDQMQILNPVLLLCFIPLFNVAVYPSLSRFGFLTKPVQRMVVGGLLASSAFVASGIVQIGIESIEGLDDMRVVALNTLPCQIQINISSLNFIESVDPHDSVMRTYERSYLKNLLPQSQNVTATRVLVKTTKMSGCDSMLTRTEYVMKMRLDLNKKEILFVVTSDIGKITFLILPDSIKKTNHSGRRTSRLRIIDSTDALRLWPIQLRSEGWNETIHAQYFSKGISFANVSLPTNLRKFGVSLRRQDDNGVSTEEPLGEVSTPISSNAFLMLYNPSVPSKSAKTVRLVENTEPSLHMVWLIPQYVLISMGEVMFSITGIEFSFDQAPQNMKAVVQASWLLTIAFGNIIVVIIEKCRIIHKQSLEIFLFAGMMLLDMAVFSCLAKRFMAANRRKTDQH